jgi:hypothetical protein
VSIRKSEIDRNQSTKAVILSPCSQHLFGCQFQIWKSWRDDALIAP